MSDEVISQRELKKDWKNFRVISKPDGDNPATFIDPITGVEREYVRVTEGLFPNAKAARKSVENSNYNVHVEHDEVLYDVVSVKEITE